MFRPGKLLLLVLVAFTTLFPARVCIAHPIIVPYPTRTLADWLLDANTIVLARESADKPFTFEAHTAIKGSLTDAQEIDMFMNSQTRRLLNMYPERSLILIRIDDGEKPKWKIAGQPDPEIELLVFEILEHAASWDQDPQARLDFFAERFQSSNRTIRNLAFLEIGRAPYIEIRKLKGAVPRKDIHYYLGNIEYMQWRALYILFLGLTDNSFDQQVIEDAFLTAARFGTVTRMTAWTTAYLEISPDEAMAAIETEFFDNPNRQLIEMQAVVAALSAHGHEGHIYLRDDIVEGYKTLLKNYPDLAATIVQDLLLWERWDLVENYRELMKDPPESLDYMSAFLCKQYIMEGSEAAEE